ncbi:MAG: hypothetical protein RR816_14025 [Clostridia bacterium]
MKMRSILTLVLAVIMLPCMAFATELPGADVASQGYDFYDKAVQYNDIRETLGEIPKLAKPIVLGFATKTFENEFWRMEKEGAEMGAKLFHDAGYDVTIDVRGAQTETDEEGQLTLMLDMINKGYDALLVSGISESNLVPGYEAAMEKAQALWDTRSAV